LIVLEEIPRPLALIVLEEIPCPFALIVLEEIPRPLALIQGFFWLEATKIGAPFQVVRADFKPSTS
jgi:hypothetical protein